MRDRDGKQQLGRQFEMSSCAGVMIETERRTAPRHRTLKAGKIVLHQGASVLDCTIRNLSAVGAALSVPNAATVPAEFELQRRDPAVHRGVAARRPHGREIQVAAFRSRLFVQRSRFSCRSQSRARPNPRPGLQ
jgi:hypothetical protein